MKTTPTNAAAHKVASCGAVVKNKFYERHVARGASVPPEFFISVILFGGIGLALLTLPREWWS